MKKSFKSKSLALFLVVLLMASLFTAGCWSNREVVTITGSTSVQPITEELASAFMEIHGRDGRAVRVEVMGGGSGAGIRAVVTGVADIGMVSRGLHDAEMDDVEVILMAIDGMAIIVHPDNPVNDLPFRALQGIFRGEITNWSEVGGADANILVVNREEGSGTRNAFHEIVIGDNNEFIATAIIQNSTGAIREVVSNDVNGIGYISLGGINDSIKTLTIDGASPTIEMIQTGEYIVARPFNYIVAEGELSEITQIFIDFVLSDEGQRIVQENGLVPVR